MLEVSNCSDLMASREPEFMDEVIKLRAEGLTPVELVSLEPFENHHALITGFVNYQSVVMPPSPPQSLVPQPPSPPLPEPEPEPLALEAGNEWDYSGESLYSVKKQGDAESGSSKNKHAGFADVRESKGFDVCALHKMCPYAEYLERVKDYAAQALEQYNKINDTKYEVNEIFKVKTKAFSDFMFYITLSVKNDEHEYFQLEVAKRRCGFLYFPRALPK